MTDTATIQRELLEAQRHSLEAQRHILTAQQLLVRPPAPSDVITDRAPRGKAMPFNRPIVLQPRLALDDPLEVGRVDMERTTSHFATCPEAAQWRQR